MTATQRQTTQDSFAPDQLAQDGAALHAARSTAETIRARAAACKDELNSHYTDPQRYAPHMENLVTIFNNIAFSPAYTNWQNERRAALVAHLTTDEDFSKLLTRSWQKDSAEQLIDSATRLSHAQQNIYALPAAPLNVRVKFLNAGTTHEGHHSAPAPGTFTHTLAFRVAKDGALRNVTTALDVIFHENTHALQAALGIAQRNRMLREDHPFYRDAVLFHKLFEDNVSYLPRTPAYRAHPLERDAFTQAELFVTEISTALKSRGLTLPPR